MRHGRQPGLCSTRVFAQVPWTGQPGVWGPWLPEGEPQGGKARKPEVFYVTLEIPSGFLEWMEASGHEMSRLGGRLAPHRVATMPQLH